MVLLIVSLHVTAEPVATDDSSMGRGQESTEVREYGKELMNPLTKEYETENGRQ